jgi:hypothetical protein
MPLALLEWVTWLPPRLRAVSHFPAPPAPNGRSWPDVDRSNRATYARNGWYTLQHGSARRRQHQLSALCLPSHIRKIRTTKIP